MSNELCYRAERTILTEHDAATALKVGWRSVFGNEPTNNQLALIWSQCALETGRFKSIWCYNFGNIKNTAGHAYYMIRCDEYINGKHVWLNPPDKGTWFNYYVNSEEGAEAYIRFLSQKKNYAKAWQEVINGDPVAFCHQLKLAHYYTADESLYTKGVVNLCNEIKRILEDEEVNEIYGK